MAFAKVIITGGEGGVMESSMNPNILETQSNSLYEISISKSSIYSTELLQRKVHEYDWDT